MSLLFLIRRCASSFLQPASSGREGGNSSKQPEIGPGGKITAIAAMILMICPSACSFSRTTFKGAPLDRYADNRLCRGCHEKLPPFHHPIGPGEMKRCISATATEETKCSYCHGAYTAQNHGTEKNSVPIIKNNLRIEDDLCFKCHPMDNPTCRDEYRGTASHFMGDPTQPDTYADKTPPLKATPWPATKLESKYGGENGRSVICFSCHVFRIGSGSTLTGPLPYHLLAVAGEKYDLGKDEDDYLCTGCHGLLPAEQRYHPLLSVTVSSFHCVRPATITETGHLNCLSCHRTHGAVAQGGCYLLKKVDGPSTDPKAIHPQIDFTHLCNLCHDP